jgi:hypothetical protein
MHTAEIATGKAAPMAWRPTGGVRLQRTCACGGTPGPDGECAACRAKRLARLQRSAAGAGPATAPPSVHEVLRSPGRPLDPAIRAFMEPRFGHDFSRVRVHADARAAASAKDVRARAYTVGPDVVFGAHQYAPQSLAGRMLLAHELTHTLQQPDMPQAAIASSKLRVSAPSDPGEQQAERMARRVVSGQPDRPGQVQASARPTLLQRAVDYDECTTAEEAVVLGSHNHAMSMITNAVTKLNSYNGTTPTAVKTALDTHFHSSGTGLASWIAFNLNWLKGQAVSPTYECQKPQEGSLLGWAMWCVPWTDIELFPLWFAESSIDKRANTMIHEWVHRYGCNFDLGYEWESGYSGHGTLRALLNADPWAHLVYDLR